MELSGNSEVQAHLTQELRLAGDIVTEALQVLARLDCSLESRQNVPVFIFKWLAIFIKDGPDIALAVADADGQGAAREACANEATGVPDFAHGVVIHPGLLLPRTACVRSFSAAAALLTSTESVDPR